MKPLTKEEFLDRKNSEIHKELLGAFKCVEDNNKLSLWFREFEKNNPKLGLCQFYGQPKSLFRVNYHYQAAFINMCEMLKNGELIVKTK